MFVRIYKYIVILVQQEDGQQDVISYMWEANLNDIAFSGNNKYESSSFPKIFFHEIFPIYNFEDF